MWEYHQNASVQHISVELMGSESLIMAYNLKHHFGRVVRLEHRQLLIPIKIKRDFWIRQTRPQWPLKRQTPSEGSSLSYPIYSGGKWNKAWYYRTITTAEHSRHGGRFTMSPDNWETDNAFRRHLLKQEGISGQNPDGCSVFSGAVARIPGHLWLKNVHL